MKKETSNTIYEMEREGEVVNSIVILDSLSFVIRNQMIFPKLNNQEIEHFMHIFNSATKQKKKPKQKLIAIVASRK